MLEDSGFCRVACIKVAARPKILPFIDMVKWVIDHLNIADRKLKYSKGEDLGLFGAEDLKAMYHLPSPQQKYDKDFLQSFRIEHPNLMKFIKEWKEN